jgi:classical protein kinase C
MSERVAEDIRKKILRERNIIIGATNMKKKTDNAAVIQKCNYNIQEAQQNIDYLTERLDQLMVQGQQQQNLSTSSTLDGSQTGSGAAALGSKNTTGNITETNYSRLDLMKYDCPSLGQRIQVMISQLEAKLRVEEKYYEANEKLSKIYQMDGDRRISSVAEDGRVQSNHKIQLLKKSLKRYEDIHVNLDQITQEEDPMSNAKFRRKPLAGTLTVGINSIREVDHISSPLFSRKTESYISIKVDDEEKAKTKGSRSDKWNEEFNIHIEKGNELEITVYDKIGGGFVPVAIAWFLISDIAEEIRKKKVGQTGGAGWVSASRIQNGMQLQAPNTSDNFTVNKKPLPPVDDSKEPIKSSSWFVLEPSGQILLTLGFTKSNIPNKKTLLGGLHRHGAIRKRDEEVFEQHGHQFVQKQFYNIMRCALCGDFLPYNGYQCQDCKFLCHKKCYEKVITKCISKSSTDLDPDELKLNHRIPHRFDHVSNKGTNWCCHCGYLLPWGRKNVLKCKECETMCHVECSHLVPDFCGMSMETANEILKTIKSTEGSRKKMIQSYQDRHSAASSNTLVSNHSLPSAPKSEGTKIPSSISSIPESKVVEPELLPTQHHRQRRPPQDLYQQGQYLLSKQQSLTSQANSSSSDERYSQFSDQQRSQPDHYAKQQYPKEIAEEQQHDKFRKASQDQHEKQSRISEEQRRKEQDLVQLQQQTEDDDRRRAAEREQEELYKYQEQQRLYQQHQQNEVALEQQMLQQHQLQISAGDLSFQVDEGIVDQHVRAQLQQGEVPNLHHHREKRHRPKVGLDDFHFIAVLGRGNFGKVMLGRSHRTKKLCAVKILKKDLIIENGEITSMQAEKDVFLIANREQHPFLINLHCCFQTANRIYFVMEYVSGGDLMWHVQQGNFSLRRAKFYAAEVLLALKYLHENGIVYRDLKLDNILLSTEGHIKIADYGLCKPDMWYGMTTNTFCGTPEFMAPEILKEQNYTRSVDWWAFGVLLYQMLLGKSPFRGDDEDEVFNAILTDEPLFPIQMASEAVSLLESLLDKNPQTRLGSGPRDAEDIMDHVYFKNINFDDILNLKVPPPYIPEVKTEEDVSFFDKDFTTEVPRLTPVNSVLDTASQAQFRGFSYVNDASGL